MTDLSVHRKALQQARLKHEFDALKALNARYGLNAQQRLDTDDKARQLVELIRADNSPGLMEQFLAEYGLSTDQGIALMCLAEALLRVPDKATIDDLIEDKIVSSGWHDHIGQSSSRLVNAATLGLIVSGKVLDDSQETELFSVLRGAIKTVGTPVIRLGVKLALKEMGQQFVLGQTINQAIEHGRKQVQNGYSYSYDMLGEAALTQADADKYFDSYARAIKSLNANAASNEVAKNPGISIKLTALHPRYQGLQSERVIQELAPKLLELALLAKQGGLGLNIDAEEANRLDLSLELIEQVLAKPELKSWDGFGVVVQAYNKSAPFVIDFLYALAEKLDRRIMVRLVKGAYWDSEIKQAQVLGLDSYPVFTQKWASDVSYICCSKKLLSMQDRIYPQFATHNAHTIAAILSMTSDTTDYEFQRLHGMGEAAYRILMEQAKIPCRIYAPVGKHKDLLAYLVRRLLENGANSSFVNQIVDTDVPVADVVADPFLNFDSPIKPTIALPKDLYAPERANSVGLDIDETLDRARYQNARESFASKQWSAQPMMASPFEGADNLTLYNPARQSDEIGSVTQASINDVRTAIDNSETWQQTSVKTRADVLRKVAQLYQDNAGEFFALLTREAGKIAVDAISELREAIDFLNYYAQQAEAYGDAPCSGLYVCISPWNFPLAIFTGQFTAALAAGNAVIAKPAESTPLVAAFAVSLFYQAGVPKNVLQLLPGTGALIGAELSSNPKVSGICFTGSTRTAQHIHRNMAKHLSPNAQLIAETGGINAMIVDSTALPEQAVKDVVASSFQSAGQRCSALRVLYVQEDIAEAFTKMMCGAMDELNVGDPWNLSSDVGPIITQQAAHAIREYVASAKSEGRLIKQLNGLNDKNFVAPALIKVTGIEALQKEVFGPVLHLATFKANELDSVLNAINDSGYGLTFGLHTRIDERADYVSKTLKVGNIYVNRDQIGAVVGSQPFGGEGLSGTGPKAGGPNYLSRFYARKTAPSVVKTDARSLSFEQIQRAINALETEEKELSTQTMPSATGESNQLRTLTRGLILCLGPTLEAATAQAQQVREQGAPALVICPGASGQSALNGEVDIQDLSRLQGLSGVCLWAEPEYAKNVKQALAQRNGSIIPLISDANIVEYCQVERHLCIDTTASGGNVSLLSGAE